MRRCVTVPAQIQARQSLEQSGGHDRREAATKSEFPSCDHCLWSTCLWGCCLSLLFVATVCATVCGCLFLCGVLFLCGFCCCFGYPEAPFFHAFQVGLGPLQHPRGNPGKRGNGGSDLHGTEALGATARTVFSSRAQRSAEHLAEHLAEHSLKVAAVAHTSHSLQPPKPSQSLQ